MVIPLRQDRSLKVHFRIPQRVSGLGLRLLGTQDTQEVNLQKGLNPPKTVVAALRQVSKGTNHHRNLQLGS